MEQKGEEDEEGSTYSCLWCRRGDAGRQAVVGVAAQEGEGEGQPGQDLPGRLPRARHRLRAQGPQRRALRLPQDCRPVPETHQLRNRRGAVLRGRGP